MARFIDHSRYLSPVVLVAANVAVFLAVTLLSLFMPTKTVMGALELSDSWAALSARPWTLLSYMWVNGGVLHLLFNLLWLYWFGQLFLTLGTDGQLYRLYVAGGLAGAVLFLLVNMALGTPHHTLIGASASVLAIVVATAWCMPDFSVGLLLLGQVRIKWIAAVPVVMSLANLSGGNYGGNVAHLGGAAMGMLFGMMIKRGTDITRPRFSRRRRVHMPSEKQPHTIADDKTRLNQILDKVKRSGYPSLTSDERRDLLDLIERL